MAVVVLTCEMGTSVKYLAETLARKLGAPIFYREVEGGAGSVNAREQSQPAGFAALIDAFAREKNRVELSAIEDICALAARGDVMLVSSTATQLLRDVPHVIRVRVRTTMALRVRKIMACMGTDQPESALTKILESDRRHSEALARLFAIADREDPAHYDLVVDTGRESVDVCAERIISLTREERHAPTADSLSRLAQMLALARAPRMPRNTPARAGSEPATAGRPMTGQCTEREPRALRDSMFSANSLFGSAWLPELSLPC
jgi:cytidylate kinase